ncbi:MAG: PAS domain S-box protein [SAR324 cluster bacterium]|nr:PAS domain S-box protein [SAR324 cluster bacterium]
MKLLRLLIIENDHEQVLALKELLDNTDIIPSFCKSPEDVTLIGREYEWDVVITSMVDSEGVRLVHNIKHHQPWAKVILHAEDIEKEFLKRFINYGVFAYVKKQYNYEELLAQISQAFLQVQVELQQKSLEEALMSRTAELQKLNQKMEQEISQRKIVEKELQKLSDAVNQTADGIVITNFQGKIEFVNPAFEKISGFLRHEVMGKTLSIVKSGIYDEKFYNFFWKEIHSGKVVRLSFKNRRKNGDLFDVDQTITPIKDDWGNITHFVSIWKEVGVQT